jgi:hypothetical protein
VLNGEDNKKRFVLCFFGLSQFFFYFAESFSFPMSKERQVYIDFLCHRKHFIPQIAELLWNEWARFYLPFNITNLDQVKEDLAKNCNTDQIPITLVAILNSELAGTVTLDYDDIPGTPYKPWCEKLKHSLFGIDWTHNISFVNFFWHF